MQTKTEIAQPESRLRGRLVRFAVSIVAMLTLVIGLGVTTAPNAAAGIDGIKNWSRNTWSIKMEDVKGKTFYVRPGEGSWKHSSRFVKKVRIPQGCYGYWSKNTRKKPMKPGWNKLSRARSIAGGTIYLFDPPGPKRTKYCSNIYRK